MHWSSTVYVDSQSFFPTFLYHIHYRFSSLNDIDSAPIECSPNFLLQILALQMTIDSVCAGDD